MGRSATWLGAVLALGLAATGCQPLTELPRPPAASKLDAPALPPPALAPEPAADPEPAPAAEGPVARFEETLAAFDAPATTKRKKRKPAED
jgi:hypothetical protein